MRHRKLDPRRPDLLRPHGGPARQMHARLRTPADLDLLPGEMDTGAERLADRLLAREAPGVVLGGVRLRVAVPDLLGREAALAKARMPDERPGDALDLDQVDADLQFAVSSHSGRNAIELMIASGMVPERSTSSGRNFPVRTSTVLRPCRCAPAMSRSMSSPTIHASPASASSASSAAPK